MNVENLIERFSRERYEPEWLRELRIKNYRTYLKLKEERIADSPFEKNYTNFDENTIIENGFQRIGGSFVEEKDRFILDLRKDGEIKIKSENLKYTSIMSIEDAIIKHPEYVKRALEDPKDELSALSNAIFQVGLFVFLPMDRRCEKTMRFLTLYPDKTVVRKDVFVVGDNSSIQFVEYTESQKNFNGMENTSLILGKNSRLKHLTMIDGNGSRFVNIKNTLMENGSMDEWYYASKRLNLGMIIANSLMIGNESSLVYRGAIVGERDEHYDVKTNIYHYGSRSKSDANVRVALKDNSRAVMRGSIRVFSESRDSSAYFAGNSLLLSPNAKSDALPFLEIEGGGSQAKHAATTSSVDYDELFYIMSRGINERDARNIIVEGFLDPVVREILIYEGRRFLIYEE